ncbi:MAG TPA: hypothetical protein VM370_06150 [Candidatus Thermoplasmatota archaeon]|nr:hypothetical protein [Candidatus Thermoplasmatota archaeon]
MRAPTAMVIVVLLAGCVGVPRTSVEPASITQEPPLPDASQREPAQPVIPPTGSTPPTPTPPSSIGPSPAPEPDDAPGSKPAPAEAPAPAEGDSAPPVVWPPPRDPPSPPREVGFRPGLDPVGGKYLRSWTPREGGLAFDAETTAVAGATLRIDSLARIVSTADEDKLVLLDVPQLVDPHVEAARFTLYDPAGVELASVDLLQESPRLHALIPAGATCDLGWSITLAEDASEDILLDVALSVAR